MKLLDKPRIQLPEDVDAECVDICNLLNRLPGTETDESCQGHGKHPFWVFFSCTDIDTISRLGRAVFNTYSDGKWEIVVDSTDTDPRGRFWLRSTVISPSKESLQGLIENIEYWFQDRFDEHFKKDRKHPSDSY